MQLDSKHASAPTPAFPPPGFHPRRKCKVSCFEGNGALQEASRAKFHRRARLRLSWSRLSTTATTSSSSKQQRGGGAACQRVSSPTCCCCPVSPLPVRHADARDRDKRQGVEDTPRPVDQAGAHRLVRGIRRLCKQAEHGLSSECRV